MILTLITYCSAQTLGSRQIREVSGMRFCRPRQPGEACKITHSPGIYPGRLTRFVLQPNFITRMSSCHAPRTFFAWDLPEREHELVEYRYDTCKLKVRRERLVTFQPEAAKQPARHIKRRRFLGIGGGLVIGLAATVRPALSGDSTGTPPERQVEIAGLVKQFQRQYDVPGLSLAMSRGGNVLLDQGFGIADQATGAAVTSRHRFRIASLSKPITSLAIFRLVDQGRLDLATRVFDDSGPLADLLVDLNLPDDACSFLRQISIQHLLEHTVGTWGNKTRDPMIDKRAIEMNHRDLIRWTLKTHRLREPPGHRFLYSNFGYCLLGRVLERIEKRPYEAVVQELVLRPAGVKSMQLGANSPEKLAPGEVRYYGQQEDPFHNIMRVDRMDAHGGWIASPRELVTLMLHYDLFSAPGDLLRAETIRSMTLPSSANPQYAKGWSVNSANNWWHIGSFNGSAGILVRTNDAWCWAMLMNSRSHHEKFVADLDALPWKIRAVLE